jgi:hypothetical protein
MKVPLGMPFSYSLENNATKEDLKERIRELIHSDSKSQSEELINFARSRDYKYYLYKLKLAIA